MTGLDWQTWTLRLGAGQNQKSDERQLESPELAKAIDVQFDDLGGLQTRYPFVDMGSEVYTGQPLSNVRRVVPNGDELLCFTKTGLFSWNAQLGKWTDKATHLAVKVDEKPIAISTGDQVQCDRAELDGTIVYAWSEISYASRKIYAIAIDKVTGSVLVGPREIPSVDSLDRPRVLALETKILLVANNSTDGTLEAITIDPAHPALAIGDPLTPFGSADHNDHYDLVKVPGEDMAVFVQRLDPATSYEIGTITAGLVVTSDTKARTCDQAIAVAVDSSGTYAQVFRGVDGGPGTASIKGDLIEIDGLVDVFTDQAMGGDALGGQINQITAAFRPAEAGPEQCHVFWSANENSDPSEWKSYKNVVDLSGNAGLFTQFVRRLGIASRAFTYDGRVYLWGVFANGSGGGYRSFRAQLQNTYFLYRDEGRLVAKATHQRAAGFSESTSHLPGVALTDGETTFSWCGGERRVIPLGEKQSGYADRGPRDISFTFDSNEARRVARLGRTLYIAGGEVLQYDGRQLVELGFHVYPWDLSPGSSGAGNLTDGTYAYKATLRYENAVGELDRSTTATVQTTKVENGPDKIACGEFACLHITRKRDPVPAVELWRTLKDPTEDAPFYLVTSKDPAHTANPNRYLRNDHTANVVDAFEDDLADEDAENLETSPENDSPIVNMSPPPASIIMASDTRLFIAGIAGEPNAVQYSKHRRDGEVASFHDALKVLLPNEGGHITALAMHFETPVAFCEHAVYILVGDGYDNAGGGQNYTARRIPGDIGAVSHEAVAATERGTVFKSKKGWYLLDAGWSLHYIGSAFADYDDETVLAVHAMKSQNQIRALTANRMLVFDTLVEPWRGAEWTVDDGVHACVWNGTHLYATADGVKQQQATYDGVDYGMVVETAWIKLADLQGFGRVRWFEVLGEYRSPHQLQIACARDYWKDGEDTFFHSKAWTVTPTNVGAREKVRHTPKIGQLEAIKIRISAVDTEATIASDLPAATEEDTFEDLIITSSVAGAIANGRTLELADDGVGAGTLDDGPDATFHYESGVTTVANLIAALEASDYFRASGTGVLNRNLTATLAGGVDMTPPAGESLKLTGISLELGFRRGLNRQLRAVEKQ